MIHREVKFFWKTVHLHITMQKCNSQYWCCNKAANYNEMLQPLKLQCSGYITVVCNRLYIVFQNEWEDNYSLHYLINHSSYNNEIPWYM
jgi:ankyrin repeat protein